LAVRDIGYKREIFRVSYEILNQRGEGDIIFLHGWGSSKLLMKNIFSKSFQQYRHLYIDLTGFGESSDAQFPLRTEDYKNIVSILLEELKFSKDTVVGHSFGGKVASLLEPKKLVLLSSSGVPVPKPLSVKLKIAFSKFAKTLRLKSIKDIFVSKDGANLSENMYETFKNVVNEDFREIFSLCKSETYIFWGESDRATPLEAGQEINRLIKDSKFYSLEGDHFFFIGKGKFIEDIVEGER
jgi:non-heme chloroperoxidase